MSETCLGLGWLWYPGHDIRIWYFQWIGLRENLQETHGFLPLNMGFSCKCSPKPIHWYLDVLEKRPVLPCQSFHLGPSRPGDRSRACLGNGSGCDRWLRRRSRSADKWAAILNANRAGQTSETSKLEQQVAASASGKTYGYGSIPIDTIFSGMNIHLPAILGFTRYQGFDPSPYIVRFCLRKRCSYLYSTREGQLGCREA